uniref:Uncharacterized protein n=1 Tax=Solanum tuberosum TaxID=4113 RepID=M1DQC0_SOLTU
MAEYCGLCMIVTESKQNLSCTCVKFVFRGCGADFEKLGQERDAGTTDHPKARSENKKAISSRRIPIDPNVPLWARGFINMIHAFGAAHHLDNMAKAKIDAATEKNTDNENQSQNDNTPGTDAQRHGATS